MADETGLDFNEQIKELERKYQQYQGEHEWKPLSYTGLCEKILAKSQTVAGFFLVQYSHLWKEHMGTLFDLFSSGKLKVHTMADETGLDFNEQIKELERKYQQCD
ncbi:hypothetical protein QJS10_CPA03g01689 [Acorus calamus]|uniref:Uncharacterized protein n=1 Tax=Acorus calamus TaxID=4465 RepID=A0AAV9FB57_ACOCL|nr:hypothetical protein QJS10_CPA03g01689 [Acorus calamus]